MNDETAYTPCNCNCNGADDCEAGANEGAVCNCGACTSSGGECGGGPIDCTSVESPVDCYGNELGSIVGNRIVDCAELSDPHMCPFALTGRILPLGTIEGACLGNDDNVHASFMANILISGATYDIGMFIATDGGYVKDAGGSCVVRTGREKNYTGGQAMLFDESNELPNPITDTCIDFINTQGGTATVRNYPFESIVFKCKDADNNGLMDFDVGISWSDQPAADCDPNGPIEKNGQLYTPPYPSQAGKCWNGGRQFLRIYVPQCE